MTRLHALQAPNVTACGRAGRASMSGDKPAVIAGHADYVLHLGDPVTCRACLRAIVTRGPSLPWEATHMQGEPSAAKRRAAKKGRRP